MKRDGPFIFLNAKESKRFHQLPDPETMRRRDAFFEEIDNTKTKKNFDGSVEIDFPDRKEEPSNGN